MELRQLRYFVAVAEELHFARAAQRVGIEQSPLSKAIKDFEVELGIPLFARSSRRTRILPAGEILLQYARKTLASVEETQQALKLHVIGQSGTLRIGIVPGAYCTAMACLFAGYRSVNPEVDITVERLTVGQQLAAIEARVIDVGFAFKPGDSAEVEASTLWSAPIVATISERHACSRHQRISLTTVTQERCILIADRTCGERFSAVQTALRSANPLFDPAHWAADTGMLSALVASDMGVGLLSGGEAEQLCQAGIVLRSLAPSAPRLTTFLLRSRSDLSVATSRFIEQATGRPPGPNGR